MDRRTSRRSADELGVPRRTGARDLLADPRSRPSTWHRPVRGARPSRSRRQPRRASTSCARSPSDEPERTRAAVGRVHAPGLLQEGYMNEVPRRPPTARSRRRSRGAAGGDWSTCAPGLVLVPEDRRRGGARTGRRAGGGSLIDMATHLLDLLEFFGGPDPPRGRAHATCQDYASEEPRPCSSSSASGRPNGTMDCFFCIRTRRVAEAARDLPGRAGSILSEGRSEEQARAGSRGSSGWGDPPTCRPGQGCRPRLGRMPFRPAGSVRASGEHFRLAWRARGTGRRPSMDGRACDPCCRVTEKAYAAAKNKAFVTI